ncbi:MAG TPA: hypothetical protein VF519_15970 [Mycobacteriales bacterium]|jgi:hypothetical protein
MAASSGGRSPGAKRDGAHDDAALYRIAFDEGRELLADQLAELSALRGRAVQFLAFVGTGSAFLVGTALGGKRDQLFYSVAGIGSTLSVLTVVVAVHLLLGLTYTRSSAIPPADLSSRPNSHATTKQHLATSVRQRIPRKKILHWSFRFHPSPLVKWIDAEVGRPTETQLLKALTLRQQALYEVNEAALNSVRLLYVTLISLGSLQLALWGTLAWLRG